MKVRAKEKIPWDRLTPFAARAVAAACAEAIRRNEPEVTPEHLLLGLLCGPDCRAARLLKRLEVSEAGLFITYEQPLGLWRAASVIALCLCYGAGGVLLAPGLLSSSRRAWAPAEAVLLVRGIFCAALLVRAVVLTPLSRIDPLGPLAA